MLIVFEFVDGLLFSVLLVKVEEVEKINVVVISRDDFFIVYFYELVECVIEELGVKRCR